MPGSRNRPRWWPPVVSMVMLAALAGLLVAGAAPRPAGCAAPTRTFQHGLRAGVDQPRRELQAELDHFRELGANHVWAAAAWWWLCRDGKGRCDWAPLDAVVEEATKRGLTVTLQMQGTPGWVHPSLAGQVEHYWYAPVRSAAELAEWEEFVGDLVTRYGTRVALYEVWNEPNLPTFWRTGPSPTAYAQLIRTAYLAAKRSNPEACLAWGQVSRADLGFLSAYYRAAQALYGDEARRNRWYFDVLGVHPYADDYPPGHSADRERHGAFGPVDTGFLGYRKMRRLQAGHEGAAKPVILEEFGYSTERTWMEPVPDPRRAEWLREAFRLAKADGYVWGMTWYSHAGDDGFAIHGTLTEEAFGQVALGGRPAAP
jgi:Cellulase (glycosyl hydrolase family 5)